MYSKSQAEQFWDYYALRKIKDAAYVEAPKGICQRFHRSIMKRMLEMSLWPYRDALKKQEDDFEEDISFMEKDPTYRFLYQNKLITMFLPQYKVDNLQKEIVRGKEFYELDLLRYVAKKYHKNDMVIIDCGANIGNHTVFFKKVMNARKIISFEGNPDTYKLLNKNIELNDMIEDVEAYNYVLGEKSSMASIDHFEETNIGGTSFCENENGKLKMVSIDEMNIEEHIDFVKMDVEGFEYHVLKGMRKILERDKPALWIEIFPDKYEKVMEVLSASGYSLKENLGGANFVFTCE